MEAALRLPRPSDFSLDAPELGPCLPNPSAPPPWYLQGSPLQQTASFIGFWGSPARGSSFVASNSPSAPHKGPSADGGKETLALLLSPRG